MSRAARLSVLIPVFNERYLVAESIRRVLDVEIQGIHEIELVVVDDCSTDGSGEIIAEIARRHPARIRHLRHDRNRGKGAALRTALEAASGDLIVVHDADLEYDPRDLEKLVTPFWDDGADVVYGSRFLTSDRRRVLYFKHAVGNRILTLASNWFTDLNLSDVETCYKMFRGLLLKSIPIRSNDFRIEIELTAKVAKRNCRVFEVPISYRGRTYREGKKIGWRDGIKALGAIFHYWVVDDLYREDEYGASILHELERVHRFNYWMADTIRPWLGNRVLEIGAGIGNITTCLIPRDRYLASDNNRSYVDYLGNLSAGKPYLEVSQIDLESPESFVPHRAQFDTVLCLNVLEHVSDPIAALRNMREVLVPEGRLVLYVPAGQKLYTTLDRALGHRCRYDAAMLRGELAAAGFALEHIEPFNRVGVPSWWWNGAVLRRKTLSRIQLKAFDWSIPLARRLDRWLPWPGLGLVAVARNSSKAGSSTI